MVSRRQFLQDSAWLALAALAACSGANASPELPSEYASTSQPPASLPPRPTPLVTRAAPTLAPMATRTAPPLPSQAYLAVAHGDDPAKITRAAVDALGGISRFVKAGDDVILKPNICTASFPPEYAATTNPFVVSTLVQMCLEAGAKRVRVMDFPFGGTAKQAYKISGILDAVERAGGQMELMNSIKYAEYTFPPQARDLKKWQVYQDILNADVFINVPIAKHHSLARVTIGMKNLLGVIQNRNGIHANLHQRIADLSTLIKPTLNLVDAVRVLKENGPTGGSLDYVQQAHTVIATHDIVAADAYAARAFFGLTPDDVGYIRLGQEMQLGRCDFDNLSVKEIQL
jgi:uncharacterized protein (DUF362 family)